ncbi:MAG: thioredoxin family protein [Euryarchaeota archaeon]
MDLRSSKRYVAIVAALCLLCVGMSGCTSISSGGYEFKSGFLHPQEINDLIKNRTVVLVITKNNCPDCDTMKPIIDDLKSQLNGTNVTLQGTTASKQSTNATKQATKLAFVEVNIDNNTRSLQIGSLYSQSAVIQTPTIVVIRSDGAIAVWKGPIDESTLKSAIEDAQKWK